MQIPVFIACKQARARIFRKAVPQHIFAENGKLLYFSFFTLISLTNAQNYKKDVYPFGKYVSHLEKEARFIYNIDIPRKKVKVKRLLPLRSALETLPLRIRKQIIFHRHTEPPHSDPRRWGGSAFRLLCVKNHSRQDIQRNRSAGHRGSPACNTGKRNCSGAYP